MNIYEKITDLIGNTPLLKLSGFNKNAEAQILAKLEYFNPAGSVKDRAALKMLDDAETKGLINKNTVIIEPTSGNTGIGLAMVATVRGYKVILTMPETMSLERRKLLSAYGAELVLTDGSLGMTGAIEKAKQLKAEIPDSFIPGQFENTANALAHYETTGPEIWNDTDGKIDFFVACVGTGGTLTGTAKYLKEKNPQIKVVAVEPENSPMLSKGRSGAHKIQGIGAGFIPQILDTDIYNEVIAVSDNDALNCSREMAKTEGVLVGISSGAALFAAKEIAQRTENKNKTVVVLLPDTGERYLSSELFE